jgi:hypothetical protein
VNRIYWDLEDEPNDEIRLLTGYMYAPHLQVGPEGREAPGARGISILMPPGQYTVKLTVGGQELTQPLTVLKDPHSAGTTADIQRQVDFLKAIRSDVVTAGESVERVEALRVQLQTLARFTEDPEVEDAAEALEQALTDLQMNMVDLRLTGQGQDAIRFEARLLQKLGYLVGGVSVADFPPTDQDLEVQQILHDRLGEHLRAVDALIGSDLSELNALLRSKGMGIIGD